MTKRPLNNCASCGYTWYPRGNDHSIQCPKCGAVRFSKAPQYHASGLKGAQNHPELVVIQVEPSVCEKPKPKVNFLAIATAGIGAVSLLAIGVFIRENLAQVQGTIKDFPSVVKRTDRTDRLVTSPISLTAREACGDAYDPEATTWYPVFIDDGDLNQIRETLCRDAQLITRKDSGKKSVQIASFTTYERAAQFASEIGGEVGEPNILKLPVHSKSKESPVPTPTTSHNDVTAVPISNTKRSLDETREFMQKVFDEHSLDLKLQLDSAFGGTDFSADALDDSVNVVLHGRSNNVVGTDMTIRIPDGYSELTAVHKYYISAYLEAALSSWKDEQKLVEMAINEGLQSHDNKDYRTKLQTTSQEIELWVTSPIDAVDGTKRVISISISPEQSGI